MRPFLDRLAGALLKDHRHELDRIAVVLPGRRAGLHLRKYLARSAEAPLWSPEVLDMGAFMERATGLTQGGALDMLFLLYEAHRAVSGDAADPFSTFLEWAPVTLRDLSEVDAHLIDHDRLYRDLRTYHELEEWSFRLGELSPGQERLNRQWVNTGLLHQAFQVLMDERGLGTSGYIARRCAEQVRTGAIILPWKKVWFAGLNALDPASTAVIRQLTEAGRACLAWEADPFYLDDQRQEAGRYLRRSMGDLGPGVIPPEPAIRERKRTIRTVLAPNALAQTTYVAQTLATLSAEQRANTVVVLAQEDLLLPLLEQLPADIRPLNVTMGMPLEALPVNGLTEAFLDLHTAAGEEGSLPLSMLEKWLGHPFLNEGEATARTIASLRELQQVRVRPSEALHAATTAGLEHAARMDTCLRPLQHAAAELSERFRVLFTWAKERAPKDPSVQEQLFQMARLQQRLDRAMARSGIGEMDLPTYALVRERLLREERIGFLGEPLRGLQVMGLLETRALDHERLIMLSVNEGHLPTATGQQSWIPFALRSQYKLPLTSDGEAISAHHFHSALGAASDVVLIHQASSESGGTGEPSRFIAQWRQEVVPGSETVMHQQSVAAVAHVRNSRFPVVHKDAAVLARLKQLCERGLSPSALGTWLRCPLDFHFRYVLGIRETDVADGTLGSDVLGDAVHHVMERLLTPFIGSMLTPAAVDAMIPQVPQLLNERLALRFAPSTLAHGHFRLRCGMASTALENYLRAERDRCATSRTVLRGIEQDVQAILPNGVKLRGRCDRIDERDGVAMILDVKTGSIGAQDLRLKSFERAAIAPEQRYALQLVMYSWAYLMQDPTVSQVGAGVIPMQRPSQAQGQFLQVGDDAVIRRDQLGVVGELLASLVNELLDPETPFMHDQDSAYCRCCVAG